MVWADFAAPPPAGEGAPDHADHQVQANAFHETARYLLLNNKKPAGHTSMNAVQRTAGHHAPPR
jgi:hypothetical protein